MDEILKAVNVSGALGWPDLLVLAGAVGSIFVITALCGRRQTDTRDYFLGSRRVPALVASLAFVATEISAVTIISVPAKGFTSNWEYLQLFIGAAAARIVVAFLFVPVYYRHNCTSIYEFLRDRFGPQTQYAGSVFFFITRVLGSGLRLGAACIGVKIIMGWSMGTAVLLFSLVSIAFIAIGGIRAIMWNGAFATVFFYAAGGAVAVFILSRIQGGPAEAWRIANEAGKLQVFNPDFNFGHATTLWASFTCALFLNMAVFGADQDFVQRLLTVRTRRASQNAMIGTILAALPLVCIYLAVGTLIFVFHRQNGIALPRGAEAEGILSTFAVTHLPGGLRGLVLAAIVLASIDSPLSSLSSSFVTDIYRPLIRKAASERHYLWVSRICVACFGVVLAVLAYPVQYVGEILYTAFKVLAVPGGSILGIFLLGILTRRRANRGNVVAMVASALAMLVLLILIETDMLALGWTWLIVFGTIMTFALGYLLGPAMGGGAAVPPRPRKEASAS